MTKPLRGALEIILPYFSASKKVLEIGSRYPNNEKSLVDLRSLFSDKINYTGVDISLGKGVDVVSDGENLPFENNSFDLVLCLETLEHAKHPWLVAKEIKRVVKKSGTIIISTPFNHEIHFHPSDYYRYTPYGLRELFKSFKNKILFSISPPFQDEVKTHPQTIVLVASSGESKDLFNKIIKSLIENKDKISVHKPYRHRVFDMIKYFRRGLNEFYFRQDISFFK